MAFRNLCRLIAAPIFVAGLTATTALAEEKTIIVLDASGSMWGQVDGKSKIEIARDALRGVVSKLDNSTSVGLMAYGHRRKGDCSDIELLVEPEPAFARKINNVVGEIKPKGKTPLTGAVRQAADALKYSEDKATVILITDGLETCEADPCALAKQLEETGVDFTAHVVGFGLSEKEGREVACLATETGGVYLQAGNAGELVDALDKTVVAKPEPEPEPEPELPKAKLMAEDAVPAASTFSVDWEGPGEEYDQIRLFDENALNGDGRQIRAIRVARDNEGSGTTKLIAPARTGAYVLEYWSNKARKVLATRAIEVTEVEVTLTHDQAVDGGATFTVGWQGPGAKYDDIEIFDPNALNGEGKKIRSVRVDRDNQGSGEVTLVAPVKPGDYQIRYWNGDNKTVMATSPIVVTEIIASLTFDSPVSAGSTLTITWDGPGAKYDEVYIWDPRARAGDGKKFTGKRVRNDDFDNKTVTMPVPAKPGMYEVRYWNGDNKTDLVSVPLEVTEVAVNLTFDSPANAGSMLTIKWEGPGARYDEVYIWDPKAKAGDGKKFTGKRVRNGDYDNQTVKLPVPVDPGTYEVRYWNGDSRIDMASVPLEVSEVAVSLDFPAEVPAGSMVTVKWEGPGARYDEVYIFDTKAKGGDGKKFTGKRIRNGDFDGKSVKLPVPVDPGTYEVRYWNGDSRKDMATAMLTVTEVAVSLDFPAEAPAGSMVTIKWEGPGARYDEVYIFDTAAKGGKGKKFTGKRVRNADFDNKTVKLPVPAQPGTYQVRYWNGDSRKDLEEQPITVTEIELGLEAPDSVEVETKFGVVWKGPGARYDEVQIVDAKGKRVASKRVRNDDFDNNKVTIKAPKTPGEYTLRYYNGDSKAVLVERPLSVN